MRIIVPIKQVPATSQVNIDPQTGALMRSGIDSKINPYDLFALECALRLKESSEDAQGATICAITMGPPQAETILREAYMMGVDEAHLITDRAFAGADVLATSYTLACAARQLGAFDLVVCGRQTTDGDTAQVGPAMAEHLGIPHAAWVTSVESLGGQGIEVVQELSDRMQRARLPFPCLITVEKGIGQPRLLSYLLKRSTAQRPIYRHDLAGLRADPARCGAEGSPTQVVEVFSPPRDAGRELWHGNAEEQANRLCAYLARHRLLDERQAGGR